jgi:DNA-binding MarR family transcriptional regulator
MLAAGFKPTLSEEERAYSRALRLALEPFRQINPSMPLSYIIAFLEVACDEGKGVAEYASKVDVSPTVMTRNLLDIGDRNRQREEGYGLITQERDLFDLRKHNAKVTPKGKSLAHRYKHALQTTLKG